MKILERAVYVGPNLYAKFPVIRLKLDIGTLEEWPSAKLGAEFTDGLLDALPGLREHGCSFREPGGFVRRLTEDEGTWMGHVLEHVAIELQNVAGEPVTFGKTRSTDESGVYQVVFEYEAERVGVEAADLAMKLVQSVLPKRLRTPGILPADFVFPEERDDFIRFAQRNAFGPSTAALVSAAEKRDIPWLRLNEYSLVQFGHGVRQERIQATVTSHTSHIAVEIASDKEETNKILGDLGLPVPKQRLVYRKDSAVRYAKRIGFPVVVKPFNANHGRGVSLNLQDDEHVALAFDRAREFSKGVIVEKFLTGFDHRILVINGEVVAASKRVPGHVVGNGTDTIEQLVGVINSDPRRGIGHEKILTMIEFDYQADRLLELLGYTKETVPMDGEIVYLRSTGNLSTGGTAVDVTDALHPDNREMAVRAAAAVGLDVAGVDYLTDDIGVSYREGGGGVCEINAAPGFRMHTNPSEGQPRDPAGAVLDMLFPGTPARIPIYSITGTNGKTTTVRMLAHIHKMAGDRVGLATTDGVYIDGQLTVAGDMTGPVAARMVLRDPSVTVAVLETARGGLLRAGMGYRKSTVSACLNVAADHLGLRDIHTLEELAEVKRIVVEIATDTAVLNADDELCLKMADYVVAERLCYVTVSAEHPLVREHIRAAGRAVILEQGVNGHMITIHDGGQHMPLLWTHLIPATLEGKALHNVQNAMFAAAVSYAGGVGLEDIRQGLRTFDSTFFQAPGRLNFYNEHPFKVLLDYAHNAHAMTQICNLIGRLDVNGRRIGVIAAPGDRRDQDIVEIGRIAAGVFDHYICRRDDRLRGRESDEIPMLLRGALLKEGVASSAIQVVVDEQEAVNAALKMAAADDLVVLFADELTRTWEQVTGFRPTGAAPNVAHDGDVVTDLPSLPTVEIEAGQTFVRDERGVRLARDTDD